MQRLMPEIQLTCGMVINKPLNEGAGDSVQIAELYDVYISAMIHELVNPVLKKIVKQFQRIPSETKGFSFSLIVNELPLP